LTGDADVLEIAVAIGYELTGDFIHHIAADSTPTRRIIT